MVYPHINILSEIKDRNARKDTPVLVDTLSAWADFPVAPTRLSIWEFQTSFLRGCRHTAHHTAFRADDVRITQFTLNSVVAFLHTKISECIYNSVLGQNDVQGPLSSPGNWMGTTLLFYRTRWHGSWKKCQTNQNGEKTETTASYSVWFMWVIV